MVRVLIIIFWKTKKQEGLEIFRFKKWKTTKSRPNRRLSFVFFGVHQKRELKEKTSYFRIKSKYMYLFLHRLREVSKTLQLICVCYDLLFYITENISLLIHYFAPHNCMKLSMLYITLLLILFHLCTVRFMQPILILIVSQGKNMPKTWIYWVFFFSWSKKLIGHIKTKWIQNKRTKISSGHSK